MKKTLCCSSILSLLIISGTAFAETEKTVEDCAKLLPSDGKQYELSIAGTITSDRKFEGELNVSDNTKKQLTDEEKNNTQSFVECVKKLIK
ncbi:TPA: hypothetical protein ACYYHR_004947 [Salmonella enterica subsp. diarizonae serovar 48:i:z]|nr:hypothetical protein [Salmonella enterica]EGB8649317.1 hypothetical protein [Salmonella enterica]EIG9527665.1 hypothetical protein [Salmonella enterica]EIG9537531.1 hypothetical protein [Salmonella enterica]EIH0810205.1 hypothetical protein [Salmonella enterica]